MRKLLIILFLLSAFLFYSYADEKEKYPYKYNHIYTNPYNYNYYPSPPSILDPNYLEKYNRYQQFVNDVGESVYSKYWGRPGVVVIQRPPTALEGFLYGLGKGIPGSSDYYLRKRQQERYNKFLLEMIKLKYYKKPELIRYATGEEVATWFIEVFEKKEEIYSENEVSPRLPGEDNKALLNRFESLFDKYRDEKEARWQKANENLDKFIEENGMRYKDKREFLNKYQFFLAEQSGEIEDNWERIKELDRIIKLKKERANLDKLFREAGWLDKDRIEYLDKYYPLPLMEGYPPLPEGYELVRPKEKEEDDLTKYMRSQGALLPRDYKMKKLNEYLKSQNLPEIPLAFEVDELFHGEWVIYWDGEKWAKKKR